MLRAFRLPIGWWDLAKRTGREMLADNCLGLAAQLAYYFFLALFPALLFLVAIVSFIPISGLLETITDTLGRVAPVEVLAIVQSQILKVAHDQNGGLLTIGMLGTIWSTSSGVTAIIDTLNQAYDITETRSWWKVRIISLGLTIPLAVFIVVSFILVVAGPSFAEKVAAWFYLGPAFTWTWKIVQWPVVFALVALAVALIYYYAPDAQQEWIWITPGSVIATLVWLIISLGFKFYVIHFGSYNATYGTIGGVVVVLLWFYLSGVAVLAGAELNAEIEHASPYGKDPGEREPGEKKKIGAMAERAWIEPHDTGAFRPALTASNCDIDKELPRAPISSAPRPSDWLVSGLIVAETALLAYLRLRVRFKRLTA